MRLNTRRVYDAWKAGKDAGDGSIWTNGVSIYSYGTTILTRTHRHEGRRPGEVVLNYTSYSHTTTEQQGGLLCLARQDPGIGRVLEVGSLPRGVSAAALIAVAYAEVTVAELVKHPITWRTA